MLQRAKAKGQIGSWFATVDGDLLPCVHKHWTSRIWPNYHDPFAIEGRIATPKIAEFVEAVKTGKRVILTKDHVQHGPDGEVIGFERDGYVAVLAVEDVTYSAEDGLRFRFVERLRELE